MDPTKLSPGVLIGGLVALVVLGLMLSKGSSGSVTTAGGTDSQQNFTNAMSLQNADLQRKTLLTTALLQYDKQSKDYTLGNNTLKANTQIENKQLDNALTLGTKAIDSQTFLGNKQLDVTQALGMKSIDADVHKADNEQKTQRQNGVLGFFGNIFGGVLKLFGV